MFRPIGKIKIVSAQHWDAFASEMFYWRLEHPMGQVGRVRTFPEAITLLDEWIDCTRAHILIAYKRGRPERAAEA